MATPYNTKTATHDQTSTHYDERAENYDKQCDMAKWVGPEVIFKEIVNINPEFSQVLDIGAATGLLSARFKEYAEGNHLDATIIAFDGSKEQLKKCEELDRAHITKQGNALYLPFDDNSMDVTVASGFMDHIKTSDREKVISEMMRVTKPNHPVGLSFREARPDHAPRLKEFQKAHEHEVQELVDIFTSKGAKLITAFSIQRAVNIQNKFRETDNDPRTIPLQNGFLFMQMPE